MEDIISDDNNVRDSDMYEVLDISTRPRAWETDGFIPGFRCQDLAEIMKFSFSSSLVCAFPALSLKIQRCV